MSRTCAAPRAGRGADAVLAAALLEAAEPLRGSDGFRRARLP
jgi:hypothetical protein